MIFNDKTTLKLLLMCSVAAFDAVLLQVGGRMGIHRGEWDAEAQSTTAAHPS